MGEGGRSRQLEVAMTVRRVDPARIAGVIRAPPSKSYTHRALVAAHLAHRPYAIVDPLLADDTRATAEALRHLGSRVQLQRARWVVTPGPATKSPIRPIDCGESGTTLRFVAALAALSPRPAELRGSGRLALRPMSDLLSALTTLGATCRTPKGRRGLPLLVRGPIRGGRLRLEASRSSQFASALLLTLPTVPGPSDLYLTGRIVSEPYIEATRKVLELHRIRVTRKGRRYSIPGGQRYRGRRMRVPGDASSAAYFWAAAALTGGHVRVVGIPLEWPQADLAILDLLERAGAEVRRFRGGAEVRARPLRRFAVDLTAAPDLYPLAAVIAATIPAASRIAGAPQVAFKESDRHAGAMRLARAMGAMVASDRTSLRVRGTARPRPFQLRGLTDHRLVMSATVGALAATGRCAVGEAEAVAKSFPEFWSLLDSVRKEPPS
jgi:3-phosphoshikimate 1-carboxyvinyltransferase